MVCMTGKHCFTSVSCLFGPTHSFCDEIVLDSQGDIRFCVVLNYGHHYYHSAKCLITLGHLSCYSWAMLITLSESLEINKTLFQRHGCGFTARINSFHIRSESTSSWCVVTLLYHVDRESCLLKLAIIIWLLNTTYDRGKSSIRSIRPNWWCTIYTVHYHSFPRWQVSQVSYLSCRQSVQLHHAKWYATPANSIISRGNHHTNHLRLCDT